METRLIRAGRDEDGATMGALLADVFAEYDNCHFVWAEFPELTAPARHFARAGGALWIAEEGSGASTRMAGSIAVARGIDPGHFELFKLYVAKADRGTGLAARLLGHALDFIRAQAGSSVVLWSDTRFAAGHRFYRKNGFWQVPGLRALHDVSDTLEFGFRRDL